MADRRSVMVVTGARSDYGLLAPVMKAVAAAPTLRLMVAATGMSLDAAHGRTADLIVADGFPLDVTVDLAQEGDTPAHVAAATGRGVEGFANAVTATHPDMVLVLGDRFETFAAATAAYLMRIPLAHIAGGDITEGAVDEGLRHAITKMASLHFVTNERAARIVAQMGEEESRIHTVGSPGLDGLMATAFMGREELAADLGIDLSNGPLLSVTFHPATLDATDAVAQLEPLLAALDRFPDATVIFTKANADAGGAAINARLDAYAARRGNAHAFTSLGQRRYLSLMKLCDVVVGNSSSGLYEAPSLMKPAVNIGDRQKGRLAASSVISCAGDADAIEAALRDAMVMDAAGTVNPYGDGKSAGRIVTALTGIADWAGLVRKHFVVREELA